MTQDMGFLEMPTRNISLPYGYKKGLKSLKKVLLDMGIARKSVFFD
jgi:hypothetical protein